MVNRFVWLLGVLVVAWALPVAAEFVSPEIGVRFPDALGPLRMQGQPHRYPQPGLGYSLRYSSPAMTVDIYVYNADQRGIGTGIASQPVVRQFAQTEGEMQAFYRQQGQQATRIGGGPETIGTAPRQTQWLVARYDVQQGARMVRTVAMVTGFRDYFVKVRATFAGAGKDGGDTGDPLTPVAAELSALLASSSQTPANPPGK